MFKDVVGELCGEGYRLFDEGRERMVGSEAKLASAFDVLSRANVNKPARLCLEEDVVAEADAVD